MYFFVDRRTSHQDSKDMNLGLLESRFPFHFSAPPQAYPCVLSVATLWVSTFPVICCDFTITFSCFSEPAKTGSQAAV